jgi:hypothetical protein
MSEAEQKMWESQVNELSKNSPHELARMMVSSRVENERLRAEVERLRGGGEAVATVEHYNETRLTAGIKLVPLLNGKSPVDIGTKLYTHPAPAVPGEWREVVGDLLRGIEEVAYLKQATQTKSGASFKDTRMAWMKLNESRVTAEELLSTTPQPEEK